MKGAYESPDSIFYEKLCEKIFKDSCYSYNSGGDPKFITDLSYEELLKFHNKFYHPSNARIFSYGDMDFTKHL